MYFWKEKNSNRASGFLKQAKDLEGNLKNWFKHTLQPREISLWFYFAIFTIWHWEKTLCQYHFLHLLGRSLHMFRSSFVKIIIIILSNNSFQHYYEIRNEKLNHAMIKKNLHIIYSFIVVEVFFLLSKWWTFFRSTAGIISYGNLK